MRSGASSLIATPSADSFNVGKSDIENPRIAFWNSCRVFSGVAISIRFAHANKENNRGISSTDDTDPSSFFRRSPTRTTSRKSQNR